MFGSTLSLESMLSGSHTSFREIVHPRANTQEFQELQREKERFVGRGIDLLRRIRSETFTTDENQKQQALLRLGVRLADQIGEYCLASAMDPGNPIKDHSCLQELAIASKDFSEVEPLSKHHIVPNQVANNLRRAAQDMLIRVEEKVGSLTSPSRRLSDAETLGVLGQFTIATNALSTDAIGCLFSSSAKVAGLLSGGLVYALMAKNVAERYGKTSGATMNVIAVAVDKDGKRATFESTSHDSVLKQLVIVDDMIITRGSILCAARVAEDVFTGADIYYGSHTSYGKRRTHLSQEKHQVHLSLLFQDFADSTESRDLSTARKVLMQASQYAADNGVTLQQGWYKRASRYFPDAVALIGVPPTE